MSENIGMFLDSANSADIMSWGKEIDGFTTNPILIGKAGAKIEYLLDLPGKKFFQVNSMKEVDQIIKLAEGKEVDDIVFKVPMLAHNVSLLKDIIKRGLNSCSTMVYDIAQLWKAMDLGVTYSIIIHAKNINEFFYKEAMDFSYMYDYQTELIAASFRTRKDVIDVLKTGYDNVTIPHVLMKKMLENPQTRVDYQEVYEWNV